jgi:hypothetical protein
VGVAWADCFLVCRFYFLWHFLRFFSWYKRGPVFAVCVKGGLFNFGLGLPAAGSSASNSKRIVTIPYGCRLNTEYSADEPEWVGREQRASQSSVQEQNTHIDI